MKIVKKYENEKLKPCPFCGGDGAILIKYGGEYKIFCGTAWCDAQFGWFKGFYHDVLKWHEPIDEWEFDGCNVYSVCKHCGKEITRDSQGNWF